MKYFSTHRLRCFCCTLILIAATHAVRADVQQRSQPAPPSSGTGVIAGTVTAADSGRGIRRAQVLLSNAETRSVIATTITDVEGRFRLTGLPAGLFLLRASCTGYLDVTLGQRPPGSGGSGVAFPLGEGQVIDRLSLSLPRGAVISGRVTDDTGEPMYNVPMRAMRIETTLNGERQTRTISSATTDDRGEYRLAFLPPGNYLIVASPRDQLLDAVRQAESLAARYAQISQTPDPNRRPTAPPPPPPPPLGAFLQAYFPGTTQIATATPIVIDVGGERPGVDLRLQPVPIATVAGTVTWTGGKMPIGQSTADTQVWLRDRGELPGASPLRIVHVPASGKFSFSSVPAGEYTLEAHAEVHGPDPRAAAISMTALWARADLTVMDANLPETMLSLEPGVSLSGRVIVEGGTAIDRSRLTVTARFVGFLPGEPMPPSATVDAEGRFTIPTIIPGRFRLTATGPGIVTKSAVINGQDTQDFPIEVKPGDHLPAATITVMPRLAELTGQVVNANNQTVHGTTVIAFASDSRYWIPFSRRIVSARQSADGRFSLKNLPAGDYRVIALQDVESGRWFDPAFLRELAANPAATSVTIADGERKEQLLRAGG